MKLKRILVENYRALRQVEMPLSNFACIIGENNAGKSSVLQALSLFFSGSPITPADFFDPEEDVRIEIEFTEIKETDIERLEEAHRDKARELLSGDALTLVRRYGTDGKGKLNLVSMVPKGARFTSENITALTRSQRAGVAFRQNLCDAFPEIADCFTNSTGVGDARDLVRRFGDSLPESQKDKGDVDLPSGLDAREKGIFYMLPEPIYIQAVKDLSDDTKTKESTPFGKVIGILLKAIESKLNEETQLFQSLRAKLNRVVKENGEIDDSDRLEEIKIIERTVEGYVQESFSTAKLNIAIPPPEIKAVLQGAQILVNDGVEGLIDSKGDGLRRAVVFAIMRAYVDVAKRPEFANSELQRGNCLLLFEEPELYLHPKAQDILLKALSEFSKHHFVVVSTHSPRFFGPNATATFVKMRKVEDMAVAAKPFADALHVDLSVMGQRDQFQLICYENNNAAFFSDTVVLVEGDSDFIVFPHIAKTLNEEWDSSKASVSFARISGKGGIKRYRDFFKHFSVRVPVISDLDLTSSGFRHIQPSEELNRLREMLLIEIDKELETQPEPVLSSTSIGKGRRSGENRAIWRKARETKAAFDEKRADWGELTAAVDAFFSWESNEQRLDALQNPPNERIENLKMELIAKLRAVDVYVLSRGDLESYYPEGIVRVEKLTRALDFCSTDMHQGSSMRLLRPHARWRRNTRPRVQHYLQVHLRRQR